MISDKLIPQPSLPGGVLDPPLQWSDLGYCPVSFSGHVIDVTLEGENYIRVFTIEFDMRPLLRVVSLKTYLRKAAIVHCHWTNTNRRMSYRLFEEADHAKLYAKYRPTYPLEVYDEIRKYCQHPESSGCDVALDVACGSGQSTFPLMDIVQKVVGMDISEKQVTEARQLTDEVEFRVGPAEDLGFQGNETVDLVTIAQAIHWLDTEKFYGEVTRVLRPGGSLVVYGYGNGVLDREEAQQTLQEVRVIAITTYRSLVRSRL